MTSHTYMWVYILYNSTGHPSFDSLLFIQKRSPGVSSSSWVKRVESIYPALECQLLYIFAHPCERGSRHGRLFNLKVFSFLFFFSFLVVCIYVRITRKMMQVCISLSTKSHSYINKPPPRPSCYLSLEHLCVLDSVRNTHLCVCVDWPHICL
jgi:hypothetical protein